VIRLKQTNFVAMVALSFNKKMIAGFIAAMSLLVFLSVVSYQTISSFELADNWVSHTIQVIDNTQRIAAKLTEAHYNKQLYTLTNDGDALKEYHTVKLPIRGDIDSLARLVRDNP